MFELRKYPVLDGFLRLEAEKSLYFFRVSLQCQGCELVFALLALPLRPVVLAGAA